MAEIKRFVLAGPLPPFERILFASLEVVVRCRACEVLSLTSAQYCECCGGRLTERDHSACRSSAAAEPAGDPEKKASETPSGEADSLWSQLMTTPAPPSPDSFGAPPVPVPPPQIPEAATKPVEVVVLPAAHAEVVMVAPPTIEPIRIEPAAATAAAAAPTVVDARPHAITQQPMRAVPRAPVAPRPAPVNNRSKPPASSQHGGNRLVLAAAVVVAAASCAAVFWLRAQQHPMIVHEEETTSVAKPVVDPPSESRPAHATQVATNDRPAAAATPAPAVSTRPRPVVPIASARGRKSAVETPASVASSARVIEVANVPAVAQPIAPAPPSGPFFDTTDVNEAPRVETRVQPELPEQLRDRSIREIVIVRVLVSQNGHPSRISLLRRSRSGTDLDNAVIAAVNQWTFAPARKRGEAVSCWLNLGVPIGRTD
jgi:TonB family protein